MFISFFKKLQPLHLYLISMVALMFANYIRDIDYSFYFVALSIGVLSFLIALYKKFKS